MGSRRVRQDLIEQYVNVGVAMPNPRYGKGYQFRVNHDRAVNLRKCFGQTVLTEEKISIFPGNFGENRIGSLGGAEITVRLVNVSRHFKRTCKIELVIWRMRIELNGAPVIGNGQGDVCVIEVELAETS